MVRSFYVTGMLSRRLHSPAPAPSGSTRVRTGLFFFHYKLRFRQESFGQRCTSLSIWRDKVVSNTPKPFLPTI